ncbi:MAG: DUF1592 domain-containing protein, partial [Gemmataceae bacterium]
AHLKNGGKLVLFAEGRMSRTGTLQRLFEGIPADATPDAVKAACERMQDFITDLRPKLVPVVNNLRSPRVQDGSQPLVIWKNEQTAANHTRYAAGAALKLKEWRLPAGSAASAAMAVPDAADDRTKYEAACERFCGVFPDAFFVSERGRVFQNEASRGRLLSAGFHNQQGYFRDDGPLYELLLDAAGKRELDRLWLEFDLMTDAPQRQYRSFIWYERAESGFIRDEVFDPFRAEDKDATSDAKMRKLEDLYLAKAVTAGAGDTAKGAITAYFRNMNATFRAIEKARKEAEPNHLPAVHRFAERAYRRPLTAAEKDGLTNFYRTLRDNEELGHEDAVRDCVVSVLVSPHFLFRGVARAEPADKPVPLAGHALAERLSYFLWASMPDRELLDLAATNELHKPEVLTAQVRRMLNDPKARGLAVEFAANWLDVRRFEEHNAVDRTRFPAFDTDLRQAMFEEPVRFFADLVARDGSVLDLLYSDHTFVNRPLARHYGIPFTGTGNEWVRVDEAGKYSRGGVLPMAVFLTKNAPGLRTSPVKRGYWVAKRVLGEHIPAPPPDVPELPADESKVERPLREALANHREIKSCASCHQRFDSLGLVFEGYGPVGERRTKDLGGRPVDATATFPGGTAGDGIAGLKSYIRDHRQPDFVDNLCRKLLAYALGRTLQLSDEKLLREMKVKLAASEYRFSVLVEAIVTSPQFLTHRGSAASTSK